MSYKALLFCPDEKTARTVTQVLTELDFSVQPSGEPFAAVKKLTSEHFDALVVDGDNHQNATLLFKTARNSGLNQNSLAVAIVEGQSGVAKAFQVGANLVLTKPINVEQSKGTLRVARGLLRKTEAAKTTSSSLVTDHPFGTGFGNADASSTPTAEQPATLPVPASVTTPPFGLGAASPTALFEVEEDPSPEPEPTEAALLESMPDLIVGKPRAADGVSAPTFPKPSPWQPISQPMAQPMATALKHADQALGKTSARGAGGSSDLGIFSHAGSGAAAAAAAAPARKTSKIVDEIAAAESSELSDLVATSTAQGSKRTGLIAALLIVAAVASGYFGWKKVHSRVASTTPQVRTTPVQPSVPPVSPAMNVQAPASTSAAEPYGATVIASPLPRSAPATTMVTEPPSAATKRTTTTISVSDASKHASSAATPEVLVVNSEPAKPTPPPTIAQVDAEPAPEAPVISPASGENAVSGLVEMPASTPQPGPHTLRVSQGVSQGLLVNKVAPVYPQRALAMRVQGAVELLATISKDGNVTDIKLLSGDTMLARAAMDAVKQWKYNPYYLDDKPLDIQTQITVNFKLPQ